MTDHVHNIGPNMTCECGYVLRIPPISFSLEIFNGRTEIANTAFNCNDLAVVLEHLKRVIQQLETRL